MNRRFFFATMAVAVLSGCGAILGIDDVPADLSADAANAGDSGTPAHEDGPGPEIDAGDARDGAKPRCDVAKPFGAPRLVVGLRSAGATDFDTSPFLTNNGQAIYFASDRSGAGDILIATRIGTDSFGDVKPVPGVVNTATDFEGAPFLTPDGLSLFFARGVNNEALFVATRASTTAAFAQPAPLTGLGTAQYQGDPFVTANGQTLYFTNSVSGATFDIFRAARGGDGAFGNAARVMELSFGPKNSRPTLPDDELTIYFTSDQSGVFRIYSAQRPNNTAAFANVALVNELAIGVNSFTGHVSGDGCTIVFSAETGTNDASELQIADKPPPL